MCVRFVRRVRARCASDLYGAGRGVRPICTEGGGGDATLSSGPSASTDCAVFTGLLPTWDYSESQ